VDFKARADRESRPYVLATPGIKKKKKPYSLKESELEQGNNIFVIPLT
jgi:hypothetical protein